MVRHVVMWTVKENLDKNEIYNKMKSKLLGLKAIIPEVLEMDVYKNINPNEKCDIFLTSLFNSLGDVETYAKHPDHVALLGYVREVTCARSAVDYKI